MNFLALVTKTIKITSIVKGRIFTYEFNPFYCIQQKPLGVVLYDVCVKRKQRNSISLVPFSQDILCRIIRIVPSSFFFSFLIFRRKVDKTNKRTSAVAESEKGNNI